MKTITIEVKKCPRCLGSHAKVECNKFKRAPTELRYSFEYWFMCPKTNEPVYFNSNGNRDKNAIVITTA
jgi:hypothetical protein